MVKEKHAAENDIRTYFRFYADATGSDEGINRTSKALFRVGIRTMNQLCALSYDEIARVRDVGPKSVELIMLVRSHFNSERKTFI